jgi:hypothetical protein
MKRRKEKPVPVKPPSGDEANAAFDVWLQRGLHDLFDGAANEAVPDEWIRMIEQDRTKKTPPAAK